MQGPPRQGPPRQVQMNINLNECVGVACVMCGKNHWRQVYQRFLLPATHPQNPRRQPQMIAVPMFECLGCGNLTNDLEAIQEYAKKESFVDDRHNNDRNQKAGDTKQNIKLV